MFTVQTAKRNLWRHKSKNALAVLIGALIVLLMNLYIGNIRSGQLQIQALADTVTVRAEITNPNGSQTTALTIDDGIVRRLSESKYVKDLRYAVALMGGVGTFAPENWEGNLTLDFLAVNTISALPDISQDNIVYGDDTDAAFLRGDQPLCLMYESLTRQNGWSPGGTARFTLYTISYPSSYYNDITIDPLGVFDLTVAGVIWPTTWDIGPASQSVILPAEWLRGVFAEYGVDFSPTSVSFAVKDPQQLNAFKAEMQALGLQETDPTASVSHTGSALKVHDRIFLNAVSLLMENQDQLRFFLPFVLIILASTGYFTSYLLMRSRRREYAVMRSLGTGAAAGFGVLLLENATLALCGSALGSLPAALFIQSVDAAILLLAAAAYFVCYLLGTLLSLLGLQRTSVMAALTQTD